MNPLQTHAIWTFTQVKVGERHLILSTIPIHPPPTPYLSRTRLHHFIGLGDVGGWINHTWPVADKPII